MEDVCDAAVTVWPLSAFTETQGEPARWSSWSLDCCHVAWSPHPVQTFASDSLRRSYTIRREPTLRDTLFNCAPIHWKHERR